jgi:predicted metalloprotease with PDZ domain
MRKILPIGGLLLSSICFAQTPVRLDVDATDAPRHLFHVKMAIPAKPGPLTLLYPEWVPGEHGPTGPITDLAGLRIEAGGQAIPWKRDSVNMYALHVDVPAGASLLNVSFDFISPPEAGGFSSGSSVTSELAVISWNQLLLYPQGVSPSQLTMQANLRVPHGWRYGTALPIASESGDDINFKPAAMVTVIDSPVSAGAHYKTIDLGTDGARHHYLHIAADSDHAADMTAQQETAYKNLVTQTGKLFGGRHYENYHFLLTLSDHVAHFGLEHHESSDDRIPERSLIDEGPRKLSAHLLPHEFVHSWNGKYRRPAGLGTDRYDEPMQGDLLWVYEGLTQYLGEILTGRTGLYTPGEYREMVAREAAEMDTQTGRAWRPLEDTAVAAQLLYYAREDYGAFRRSVDYYPEGALIWLEADVTIRKLSNGSKSLDDFCRAFHGGASSSPSVKPYVFDDVVAALNAVQPYDWKTFLNTRLRSTSAHAPLGGIEGSGWKLSYSSTRSPLWIAREEESKIVDLTHSLGFKVKEDGSMIDVVVGGPAARAGVAPAVKLIAVNGRQYNPKVLREAVQEAVAPSKQVELLVKDGEFYFTHRIEYHGGERYPALERDPSKPDLLSEIIRAR